MKVAILAGGAGSRFPEETDVKPKPMIEIGGVPILWHIMRYYASFGCKEFVIALGYKGQVIKRFATERLMQQGDLRVDPAHRRLDPIADSSHDCVLDLIDTGPSTNTGGRIKRLAPFIGRNRFFLTWGDGLADVDLHALLAFHEAHGRLATLTAVRAPARLGHVELDGVVVRRIEGSPRRPEGWINGAFFVLEPEVFDYIEGDATQFEHEPMRRLAREGQLRAFRHDGFWQCMDTPGDRNVLEAVWASGTAPWAAGA